MVQGTSSHVGKSVLTAALCRIFRDRGFSAAPFKAQNMALNSFVTKEGREIGRAQAFQAEAAGIEPTSDMNPVLLKPTGDSVSQVIIHGRVFGVMGAVEYHSFKREAARFVMESYSRLAAAYDVIVIEGAGSPAEVNLREGDIANMGVAEMTGAPVILAGDIDRGGVFASLVGTLELLAPSERERVRGFIINKFRGDMGLLRPGLDFLFEKTGRPVLGVVPYLDGVALPDEDGVALQGAGRGGAGKGDIRIAVIKLPRISNFTDFDPLKLSPGVELEFIEDSKGLAGADMAIIPGTKNTLSDLAWLKERGFERGLADFAGRGGMVAGICGGFQMMGRKVSDPLGVESSLKEAKGLGLLDAETVLKGEKAVFQVKATVTALPGSDGQGLSVEGYEIHMGKTTGSAAPFARITGRNGAEADILDGGSAGNLWGTYIHGIFDNDAFREALLSGLRAGKGISSSLTAAEGFREQREASIKRLAGVVEESLDMEAIMGIAGLG
ncbi:MAG: cobyric acid synthase [Deltaproteobacteria bacterium]|nr:cobyric acid synthase [Deltaproteobacteria bacterium]